MPFYYRNWKSSKIKFSGEKVKLKIIFPLKPKIPIYFLQRNGFFVHFIFAAFQLYGFLNSTAKLRNFHAAKFSCNKVIPYTRIFPFQKVLWNFSKKQVESSYKNLYPLYSGDWGHIGIKKRTNHVIYHWKGMLSGSQKKYVNTILSVNFRNYDPPSERLYNSKIRFFAKRP